MRNGVIIVNVKINHKGSFDKTMNFLNNAKDTKRLMQMMRISSIADQGVKALEKSTPVDTGKTAASWGYEIEDKNGKVSIYWTNSNVQKGVNIAIILQYGHGTKNGGYVEGRDYINDAMKPIFDKMANDMWKAVVSL